MKNITLCLVVLFIALAAIECKLKCVEEEEPEKEKEFRCPHSYGNYGNPTDCDSYYMCVNGKPRLIRCRPFTQFSERVGRCVFKGVADCRVKSK